MLRTLSRRERQVVGILVILALVLRIGAAVAAFNDPIGTDAHDYERHAISIAHGHGYPRSYYTTTPGPTALRPPGYPFFLGGIYALTGDSRKAARLVQAIVGVLAVVALGWAAARLFGRLAGFATLALAAVYPPLVLTTPTILTEALFVPLAAASIAAALWAADAPDRRRRLVLTGVLIGLTALTRVNGALLLIPAALIVAARGPNVRWRARLARPAVVVGVAVLCLAPWTIRNAIEFHAFVPVAIEEGVELAGTMNDEARTDPKFPALWRPANLLPLYADIFTHRGLNEAQMDDQLRSRALHYLGDHPGYGFTVLYRHTLSTLHLAGNATERQWAVDWNLPWRRYQVARFAFYALAALLLASLPLLRRRVPVWLWLTPLLYLLAAAIGAGTSRYRLPVDLFLVILAGPGLAWLATRVGLARRLLPAEA